MFYRKKYQGLAVEKEELKNKCESLQEKLDDIKTKYRKVNSSKGGYIAQINRLILEIEKAEEKLKEKDEAILKLQKQLEESMTDKYRVVKLRPTKSQNQKMKIRSFSKQSKVIKDVKEI